MFSERTHMPTRVLNNKAALLIRNPMPSSYRNVGFARRDTVATPTDRYVRPTACTTTFFAKVLKRSPSFCTTVIVTAPVLLVLMSLTVPDLPACVPATTVQES